MQTTKTGLVWDLPAEQYFANPALGSTSIKTLSDPDISMAEAQYLLSHNEHKPAYDVGTLAHALILEGSLDHLVQRVEYDNYYKKEAKAARDAAYADGLIPINNSEVDSVLAPVEAMREAVMAHPIARELFTSHEPEVSAFWEQDGVPLKGRIDALHTSKKLAVDLKTIRSARPDDVRKQISDYGYYIQARHYLNGMEAVTGDEHDWLFVMVGKTAPYSVSVHRLAPFVLEDAQIRIDHAISRYKTALEHGWTGYEQIYEHELTPWEAIKNEALDDVEIMVGS